jgi:hypothetical protein
MRWSKPENYAEHHEDDQCGKDDYRKQEFVDFHQGWPTWCLGNGYAASPSGYQRGHCEYYREWRPGSLTKGNIMKR